jgi:hypothetical protein
VEKLKKQLIREISDPFHTNTLEAQRRALRTIFIRRVC